MDNIIFRQTSQLHTIINIDNNNGYLNHKVSYRRAANEKGLEGSKKILSVIRPYYNNNLKYTIYKYKIKYTNEIRLREQRDETPI